MAAQSQSTLAKPGGGVRRVAVPESPELVSRAVNSLAWPIILENVFQSTLGTVEMMIVGVLGSAAIAGIGSAMQIMFVLQAAFGAVTTGTTVLIARAIGARDQEEANLVTKQSILLGAMLAIILGIVGYYFADPLIALLGAEPEVVRLGGSYLRITMVSGIVLLGMFVIGGAFRGAGDTRTPMYVTGGINVINIVASYVLILGFDPLGIPALGVVGAACAAALSRTIGCAVLLTLLIRGKGMLSIRGLSGWLPDPRICWRITRLGAPSMAEQLAMSGGTLVYGIIAISMGTTVYAAQRITFQALSLSFLPGMGFAMAATAMVGQCLGARRPDLSELATWYSVKAAMVWMLCGGLVMFLFGAPIMRLFTDDPEMIAMGADGLKVIAASQPFMAIAQVLAGSLRGAGDTRFPMYSTALGVWLVRLPMGYLFGPVVGWGLAGLYISNVLDAIARSIAQYWRYRSGRWRGIEV
ncbi:MAG: MATE family efflux transporter [Anaerolineae bacterium]|jgi:putative MATE family efflux protein